jgi:signal transduction histidine kinase
MGSRQRRPNQHIDGAGEYSSHSRVERIVAIGRLVIIPCCLLAFGFDPASLGVLARIGFALLVGYFVYVVSVSAHVWLGHEPTYRWRIADQALDGIVGFVLLVLTGGTSSPFFSYLSFPVFFATLRWQWPGALAAGTPVLVAFVALAPLEIYRGALFEPNTFIIRTVYLGALTGLLCYVGAYDQRARRAMVAAATWSPPSGVEPAGMGALFEAAATVLGARRAVLVWSEDSEQDLHVASWTGSDVQYSTIEEGSQDDLVAGSVLHLDFLSRDVTRTTAPVLWVANGRLERQHLARAVSGELQRRFGMRSVIAVRLRGTLVRGRLFFLDMRRMTSDDLMMASLLARQFQLHLEYGLTARKLAEAATAEERISLARNVHDGALQALTGIRLQLEAARRLIVTRPDEAAGILLELEDVVRAEHQTLRRLVTRLQRAESSEAEPEDDLADMITVLVLRIERQWNVRVKLLSPIVNEQFEAAASKDLISEIYQIVREALVNAARHARAKTVTVSIAIEDRAVAMTVADDGEGFPFTGRYGLDRLIRYDMGPTVLRDRVAALDGQLTIESSPQGARLEISIPLAPPARLSPRRASST